MLKFKKSLLIMFSFITLFGLQACEDEGPLEEAGEGIEEAGENTGDAVEDTFE